MYLINTNLCHVASHKGLNTDLNTNAIVQKHYWRFNVQQGISTLLLCFK